MLLERIDKYMKGLTVIVAVGFILLVWYHIERYQSESIVLLNRGYYLLSAREAVIGRTEVLDKAKRSQVKTKSVNWSGIHGRPSIKSFVNFGT